MSAQAGILYADSRPVPHATIELLSRFNSERGPDGTSLHVSDGLAMLSFGLHFDNLSRQERQPVRSLDGTLLTWDGRLDNREDFLVTLNDTTRPDHTDAALISQGIAVWGLRALEKAIGDWSLAHIDPVRRELCLASDYAGNRPLYYCCRPGYVAWSTCFEALAPICGVAGQISDIFIARMLTLQSVGQHTPYPDIMQVRAGTALLLKPGVGPQLLEIAPLVSSELRYRRSTEYEDHYRELFTEAVRVRLRTHTTVWTELSGGYDSSSITCVAARLIGAGVTAAPRLQPVSHVYPQSPESDESPYIAHVEEACRLSSLRVPRTVATTLTLGASPWLIQTNSSGEPGATEIAARHGCRVLLSGELGDLVSVGARPEDALLDHFSHGRVGPFVADSLAHCRANHQQLIPLWIGAIKMGVSPRRHHAFRQFAAQWAAIRHTPPGDITSAFGLSPRLVPAVLDDSSSPSPVVTHLPRTRRAFADGVRAIIEANVLTAYREPPALCVSFPFAHRPLVRFILSAPPSVIWRPHHPRAFICSALADVLPPAIITRGHKGFFPPALTRRLVPAAMDGIETVDTWRLAQRGYIEPAVVRDILRGFLDGSQATSSAVHMLLGAESLVRRLEYACSSISAQTSVGLPADADDSRTHSRRTETVQLATYSTNEGR